MTSERDVPMTTHTHAASQSALQGCLALLRGLDEAILGHLMAALNHSGIFGV
jgi:hypothetical protein